MEGNNSLGVGLVVIIPLMVYLFRQAVSKYVRSGWGCGHLISFAVLGSYSRGALLSVLAMFLLLWYRSTRKAARCHRCRVVRGSCHSIHA